MSGQYDNKNTVALFPSAPQGQVIGSGKIFFGDVQKRTILVDDVTPSGKPITRIFVEAGALWPMDASKKTSEKSPDFTGKLELPDTNCDQIALWTKTSTNTGNQFWAGTISKNQRPTNGGGMGGSAVRPMERTDLDDVIPF
jgi:hypothetical protein